MLKTLPLILAFVAFVAAPAFAKTLKPPNDDFAVATIDVPDSWKPEAIDNGFEAESSDMAVYLSAVVVGTEKSLNAEIADTFKYLKEHKVELDESTKKEQKFTVNGVEASELVYQGKDEDGPATISIALVPINNKLVIFTYWASTEEEKKHSKEVGAIVTSLKPAGS